MQRGIVSLWLALWLFCHGVCSYSVPQVCQPITVPFCSFLPYNMTKLPNELKQESQELVKASLGTEEIKTLVGTNCSDSLVFFLCVFHLPICIKEFHTPILPCRSLCNKVRSDCLPTIKKYGRDWPIDVDCNKFPTYDKAVCVKPESFVNYGSNVNKRSGSGRKSAKESCRCRADKIMSLKKFKARGYDFVIVAQVTKILTTANHRQITLTNKRTIREGLVPASKRTLTIHTNSSCTCPLLQNNHSYLIMGREDVAKKRLVLNRKSFAHSWPIDWRKEKKKQKWRALRQFLKYLRRHNINKSSRKAN